MKTSFCFLAAIIAASALSGCATIIEGTHQNIAIRTNAPAATCTGYREGQWIFYIPRTPQIVNVSKSRHDIDVACTAPGYEPTDAKLRSSLSFWGGVSIATTDFGLTDYATGALNKYPDSFNVRMKPIVVDR